MADQRRAGAPRTSCKWQHSHEDGHSVAGKIKKYEYCIRQCFLAYRTGNRLFCAHWDLGICRLDGTLAVNTEWSVVLNDFGLWFQLLAECLFPSLARLHGGHRFFRGGDDSGKYLIDCFYLFLFFFF